MGRVASRVAKTFSAILGKHDRRLAMGIATIAVVLVPAVAMARYTYPADVTQEFIRGCEASGQPARFCACTLERIQAEFSFAEFTELSRQMMAIGSPPRSIVRLMVQCLDTPTPPSATPPTPSQVAQLNSQLQAAVSARDWDRAIQIVDRMIVLFPQRSAELLNYRSRLESLRGR
ncbi:MAG: hypothetical protein NZ772_17390 [Cyanobacteria bacterium]|nr:hypothetical protein [Cyanobacteriota bacterium]